MEIIKDVPQLAEELYKLAMSHTYLEGPTINGEPTYWLVCCTCNSVLAVPENIVSIVCDDCQKRLTLLPER